MDRVRQADPPEVLERFHGNLDLVDVVARTMARRLAGIVDLDELRSACREGLLEASRRFDPARQIPFRAFARRRIRGAAIDRVRKEAMLPRRAFERLRRLEAAMAATDGAVEQALASLDPAALSDEAEQRLAEQFAAVADAAALRTVVDATQADFVADGPSPEEAYSRAELWLLVDRVMTELPATLAQVIRLYYFENLSMRKVAESLGLTKPWASRLHARAIAHLSARILRSL